MVIPSPPNGEASITSPPETSYAIVNHASSPDNSSESEAALSDAEEEHTPQQESASTPESNPEEEEEMSSNSSSDEDVEGQSEDGDYEVETPVEELAGENGYESAAKSAKESRKSTKVRVADDYNENPDLYGLRRSVSSLSCVSHKGSY